MKIATFTYNGSPRIGIVVDQQIADVCAVAPQLPRDLVALLTGGPAALEQVARAAEKAPTFALSQVKLEARFSAHRSSRQLASIMPTT